MVSILPRATNVGTDVGQSISQGLQLGGQQGFQRGLLQNALGKVKDLFNQTDAEGNPVQHDPLDLMVSMMQAGAGIPGSEKYLATLLPALLNYTRTRNIYPKGGNAPGQQTQQPQPGMQPPQQGQSPQSGAQPLPGKTTEALENADTIQGEMIGWQPGQEITPDLTPRQIYDSLNARNISPAGFLEAPQSPEEMRLWSEEYARQLNDPNAFPQGMQIQGMLNQERQAARQELVDTYQRQYPNSQNPEEEALFLETAKLYQSLPDMNDIKARTINRFNSVKGKRDALSNVQIPGPVARLIPAATSLFGGITGAVRKEQLSPTKSLSEQRLQPAKNNRALIQDLVKDGQEGYVRRVMADKWQYTPTEVGYGVHPPTTELKESVKGLPKATNNADINQKTIKNFMGQELKDKSLLVLRNELLQKGYNWQDIVTGFNEAHPDLKQLNDYQKAEIPEMSSPPRASLMEIFSGYGSPTERISDIWEGKI